MLDLDTHSLSDWRLFVNGRAVVRGGEHTGNLPGRVLRPAAA